MVEKKAVVRKAIWIVISAVLSTVIVYSIIIPYSLPAFYLGLSGRAYSLISILIYLSAVFAILLNILKYGNMINAYSIPYFFPLFSFILFSIIVNLPGPYLEYSRWVFISITLPVLYMTITASLRSYQVAEIILLNTIVGGSILSGVMIFTDASGNFPSLAGIISHRGAAYFLGQSLGPVALANLAGLTFICSLVLYRYSEKKIINYLMIGTMPLSLIGLVISGGRMAILAILICIVLMIFAKKIPKRRNMMSKLYFGAGILIVVIVIHRIANTYNPEIIDRVVRLPATLINYSTDVAIVERIELWSEVLSMIKKNPFGLGFDTFFNLYGLTTHNEYFNILLGAGIQGLLAFLAFGYLTLRRCYLTARIQTENYAVPMAAYLGGVFMAFVSLTSTWTYSNSITSLMIWIIIACGVSVSGKISRSGLNLCQSKMP